MFNTITLENGLRIVTETVPFVRSIAFGIWVKNGSRNESIEQNGISHFIEHMFFKGTTSRLASDIASEIDSIGGQINAFTAKEYTCYYTLTLDTHFDTALDILADMFFNSKFDEKDIKKELNVIIEEINMYEDSPEELVHDLLQSNVWKNDSLGYPILGEEKIISSFNKKIFKNYYNTNYHPQNTVIAIAGNFESDDMIKKIEKYFGDFSRSIDLPNNKYKTVYTPSIVTKEKEIEQIHMAIGFPSIPIGSENAYDLAIFNTIFGSGMSSRLFQKIREDEGLAYSVYSYASSYIDMGLFTIYAGLNPSQSEKVINIISREIKNIFTDKITESQLIKTKEQLKSNYLLSLESSSSRMNSIGKSQLMLNKIIYPEEIIKKIDNVTIDRIYELIEKIFIFDNMSLSVVGNIKGLNFVEMVNNAK